MIYAYLAVAAVTLYLVRMLPLALLRRDIKSRFIRSFLYYVPYVTLSVMTVPAILNVSEYGIVGLAGFLAAVIIALKSENLFKVAIGATLTAVAMQALLTYVPVLRL